MTTSSGHKIDEEEVISGVVRWYDPNRGYGFVARHLNAPKDEDLFIHSRHIPSGDRLTRWPGGQKITYKIRINHKTGRPEACEAVMES